MSTSVQFARFVGLRSDYRDDFNDFLIEELDWSNGGVMGCCKNGLKFMVITSMEGEPPYWLVPVNAKSICVMAEDHWDGHGGGAGEFNFMADPLTEEEQAAANAHDLALCRDLRQQFQACGRNVGEVELVLGWVGTMDEQVFDGKEFKINQDFPKVNRSEEVASHGPWTADEAFSILDPYYEALVRHPTEIVRLPYGKASGLSHPAIPIR